MRTGLAGLLGLLLAIQVVCASDRWQFGSRIAVSDPPRSGVFHHLDGAGRKHIAVAGQSVAVVWEDNRNTDPQVFVAQKNIADDSFTEAIQVSSGDEAYEPSISAVGGQAFAISWEQDGAIYVRLLTEKGLGEMVKLSSGSAAQSTISAIDKQVFVAWPEQVKGQWSLRVARLSLAGNQQLVLDSEASVEEQPLDTPLLFPTLAVGPSGLCVAWEDRRAGHTRLLYSYSGDLANSFSAPLNLNEFFSNRNAYDKGSGVTRVAMAAFGEDEVLATWMDKRRGVAGYGIFAALGAEGGESFGPNEKVHGEEGDKQPHYNPAAAGNQDGDFVVAWDDFRKGDSDIWISGYNDDFEWSQDYAPAPASGPGEQSHASITLDDAGGLHLLWIERADLQAPTQLWYSFGRPDSD